VRLAGRPARPAGPRRSGEEGGLWWSSEQSNSGAGRKERGEDNADRWAQGIGGRESECCRGLLGCGRGCWAWRAGWPRASERVGPRETMGRVEVWADILG